MHLDQLAGTTDDLVRDELLLGGHLVMAATHESLDGEDGVLGVRDGLPLGGLSDQAFLARKTHNRRC